MPPRCLFPGVPQFHSSPVPGAAETHTALPFTEFSRKEQKHEASKEKAMQLKL